MPSHSSWTHLSKRANRIPNGLPSTGNSRIATHTFSGKLTPKTEPEKDVSRLVQCAEDRKPMAASTASTAKAGGPKMPDVKELSAFPVIDSLELAQMKQPKKVLNHSPKVNVKDVEAFPVLAGPSQRSIESSFPLLRIVSAPQHPRVAALRRNR
ncbi:hypothetical protein LTR85_010876 [Meristemomyces frigidus]|nr:hypothetical protein LTR85_010876 [Meristemomyces frigidus]